MPSAMPFFLCLIELTITSFLVTEGKKRRQFVPTVYKYQPLNLDLVRPVLNFYGSTPLLCSYRRQTLPGTFHQ